MSYDEVIMERVGIRDLKQNASAIVRRAAARETVEITDRGGRLPGSPPSAD
jgi:hypothetical protein